MSFRFSSGIHPIAAALIAGSLLWGTARAQTNSTPSRSEYSESSLSQILTNMNQLSAGQDGKTRLEEEMKKTYTGFSLKGSLGGSGVPQISPAQLPRQVPNRHLQDELNRQKEWMFMRPEDFNATPSLEEILHLSSGTPEAQEKSLSPMERFLQNLADPSASKKRLKTKKSEDSGSYRSADPFGEDPFVSQDDDKDMPASVKEKKDNLRKLLSGFSADRAPSGTQTRGTLSDIFGLGADRELTPEQIREHKDYLQRYREILGGNFSSPTPGLADGLLSPTKDAPSPASTSLYGLRPDGFDSTIGRVNPTYVPTAPMDLNSKILTQWNPLPAYTLPDSTKPAQSFTPIQEFPRRRF